MSKGPAAQAWRVSHAAAGSRTGHAPEGARGRIMGGYTEQIYRTTNNSASVYCALGRCAVQYYWLGRMTLSANRFHFPCTAFTRPADDANAIAADLTSFTASVYPTAMRNVQALMHISISSFKQLPQRPRAGCGRPST